MYYHIWSYFPTIFPILTLHSLEQMRESPVSSDIVPISSPHSLPKTSHHGIPIPSSSSPKVSTNKREKRMRWHLGIRAKSRPQDILRELCQALITLEYEWKIITPFHLRCRPKNNHSRKVRIGLQLYEVEGRTYIVDFKCIMPPASELESGKLEESDFPQPLILDFFERCYAIIKTLPQ